MPYWTTWDVDSTIDTTVGAVATAITFVLFASPIKTMRAIHEAGATQSFRGDPFIYTFFNCSLWVTYSIYQGLLMPLICNIVGMLAAAAYISFFAYYLPSTLEADGLNAGKTAPVNHPKLAPQAYTTRRNYLLQLFGLLACVAVVGGLLNLPVFDFDIGGQNFPAWMFGLMADIFNVIMYGSPLAMMRVVITTKSVKFMPFLYSFMTMWCTFSWVCYGVYIGDIWITIPNVSGLMLAIAQLILYWMYSKPSGKEDSKYKQLKDEEDPTSPRRSSEAVAEDENAAESPQTGEQDDEILVHESPK